MKSTIGKLVFASLFCLLSLSAKAEWQCYVADKGGHVWMSPGMTEDHANSVASSFCTAYSPNSSTCHVSQCIEK